MTDELSPEVLITNIPFKCDEEDIRACCAQFGDVLKIQLGKKDGKFRGYTTLYKYALVKINSIALNLNFNFNFNTVGINLINIFIFICYHYLYYLINLLIYFQFCKCII